jgi:photosystem II stability/assembly factor-like uncharacterized protein
VCCALGLVPAPPAEAAVGRWTTHGPAAAEASAVAVSPSDPSIIYAGVPSDSSGDFGRGLYKSVDGGHRWKLLTALTHRGVTTIAVAPSSSDILYVGTSFGVVTSTDGGESWRESWTEDDPYVTSLAIDPSNPLVAYSGVCCPGELPDSQLYKTIDGGVTWTSVSNDQFFGTDGLAIDPT